jgi:hypothetical protein
MHMGPRISERSQPGDRERPEEAEDVTPPVAVPVTPKEKGHDGLAPIRLRRPGEDTDIGRDMRPDITDPGPDLRRPRGAPR